MILEEKFLALAEEWRAATLYSSSVTELCNHPAYTQIISMGKEVVPLLLGELIRKPDHWFMALTKITGENPIGTEDVGDLEKMCAAWVCWGKSNNYL